VLTKLTAAWLNIRSSLWFLPAVMTLGAACLAFVSVYVDRLLLADQRAELAWLFEGGADGARGVLSAIAGGLITVTGVTFSITIVSLQLASSQFTPRVLRSFTANRATQVVLGVFIGTFTYALLVLRSVRSAADNGEAFVPSLSVTTAIVMAISSVGFLIFFIHHISRNIQASVIIDQAAGDAHKTIEKLFPSQIGQPAEEVSHNSATPESEPLAILSDSEGYLQHLDEESMFAWADKKRLLIRMEIAIGDFVSSGVVLVSIWPAEAVDDEVIRQVRQSFVLGEERTTDQDIEFSLIRLVDIASKALSPGINDPTTAKVCLDRLGGLLILLGNRAMPEPVRCDTSGRTVLIASRPKFYRLLNLAFDDIRTFGVATPSVAVHMLLTLNRIARHIPLEQRALAVRQAELVLVDAARRIENVADSATVKQAGAWIHTHES
jgi:uncharacterized membrane protein